MMYTIRTYELLEGQRFMAQYNYHNTRTTSFVPYFTDLFIVPILEPNLVAVWRIKSLKNKPINNENKD